MNGKRNTRPEFSVISLRLPSSLHDRLKVIASAEERTVSQELRLMVSNHVERVEAQLEEAA